MANPNAEQNGLLDQDRGLEQGKRQSVGRIVCWTLIVLVAVAVVIVMVLFIPGRLGSQELFDEVGLCSVENGGCQHNCSFSNVSGVVCSCLDGYALGANNRSCGDINECESGDNDCQQICVNKVPFFTCSCHEGYLLNDDGKTCNEIDVCATEVNDCEQICIGLVSTFRCDCNEGFQLSDDNVTCDDINECNVDNGGCEQTCENTEGSFVCHCGTGYVLNADGRSCDAVLYYTDSASGIYSVVAGGDPVLLSESQGAYGIDYECSYRYIFWSSVTQSSILRGRLQDGGLEEVQNVVTAGIEMPTDVAVDSFNGRIYWADNEHEHIASASLDGSEVNTNVIADTGRRDPLAVAVNPMAGDLYWGYQHRLDLATTEYGIEQATLDGENSTILVEGLDALTGLKYDPYADRLCWCDDISTIECMDLTTSQRQIITADGKRPFDMAFTQDSIYWISNEYGDVMALARNDNSGLGTRFNISITNPRGITAESFCP